MDIVHHKLADILDLFALHPTGAGAYLGRQPDDGLERARVYGGQVAGQAIAAAAQTVSGRRLHSLHVAFLRPGNPDAPLHFEVAVLREGRTFSTRRVSVSQDATLLMEALVSFLEPIDGDEYQRPMPEVADPESLPDLADQLTAHLAPLGAQDSEYLRLAQLPLVQFRYLDPPPRIAMDDDAKLPGVCRLWLRLNDSDPGDALPALRDDPILAACMLAYISDWTILDPVQVAMGKTWQRMAQMASLDHAIWFHRPVDFSDWLLYEQHSPSVNGGVGLGTGAIFNRNGELVCTVTQEGFVGRRI